MLTRVNNLLTNRKAKTRLVKKKYVGKRSIGQKTEIAAINFLTNNGLILLDTNVYYRFGEIDLVLLEQNTIVFVEVKYRSTDKYGSAIEAITTKQTKRLQRAAEAWLQRYDANDCNPCRFDLVAMSGPLDDLQFLWLKNIFQ